MKNSFDSKQLRNVAGAFPTGVTVITILDEAGEVQGMTASSFLSVSLDPPLVSVCVTNDADFMKYAKEEKTLAISILSEDQKEISNQFAGMNKEDIDVKFSNSGAVPIIADSAAWYQTEIKQIIPAGDHKFLLCEITDLGRDVEKKPLVYYSGYRSVGDNV